MIVQRRLLLSARLRPGCNADFKGQPGLLLEFGLLFHRFSGRKFSIPVRFGARGTRVQFTDFSDGCATSGARHSKYLFRGEIFGLHNRIVQLFITGTMFHIAH